MRPKTCTALAVKPTCTTKPDKQHSYVLEYINDTGAGAAIYSDRALQEQGVPKYILQQLIGNASQSLSFEAGGGMRYGRLSLGMSSGTFGTHEVYRLPESPFAASLGETVQVWQRPFIWMRHDKPYHVTDMPQIKIHCPL